MDVEMWMISPVYAVLTLSPGDRRLQPSPVQLTSIGQTPRGLPPAHSDNYTPYDCLAYITGT